MTKRFSELTDIELIDISNDDLNAAIRIEAIERGLRPPMPLSEKLASSEFRGYVLPAEFIKVWKLRAGYSRSCFGWLTEEAALAALSGAVEIEEIGYPAKGYKLSTDDLRIEVQVVSNSVSKSQIASLELADTEETEEFRKVVTECMAHYQAVRQAEYDNRVNGEKRAEYMRLANGDEEVAKRFWSKIEKNSWPGEIK